MTPSRAACLSRVVAKVQRLNVGSLEIVEECIEGVFIGQLLADMESLVEKLPTAGEGELLTPWNAVSVENTN